MKQSSGYERFDIIFKHLLHVNILVRRMRACRESCSHGFEDMFYDIVGVEYLLGFPFRVQHTEKIYQFVVPKWQQGPVSEI